MKIAVYAIGKLKRGVETDLCNRYIERIDGQGRGQALGPVTVVELNESQASHATTRKSDEAEALLARIPSSAYVIALDERGKAYSSVDFSNQIKMIRDNGNPELAFVIGGPDGHGDALKEAAQRRLAFGPMTLPHGLARAVLLEQVYRAITILDGHPYHRA